MATSDTEQALSPEERLTKLASAERLARAHNLTKNYMLGAASIGLIPLPLVDLGGLVALQVKLVHGLAKHYDVPFKENIAKSLVASLLSGVSGAIVVAGLWSLAKAVPVLGTLAGGGGFAVTGASVTYATGEVFIQHFESGGTLLDFDPQKVKSLFKSKLKKGSTAEAQDAPTTDAAATAS